MRKSIKQSGSKKLLLEEFNNLDEFMAAIDRPTNTVFSGRSLESKQNDYSFTRTRSYDEALELLRNGWTEKLDEVRKEMASFERLLEQDVSYEKKRPSTSPIGFAPHVPNAIMGLPNSMIRTETTPMKTKIVRIVYKMSMNAGVSAKEIMDSGLLVLKLAHALEKKGLRVRIDVSPKFSDASDERVCALVCIKDWRQPLDLKKVAFPIAHPSMFRRFGFKWMETAPDIKDSSFEWGYGSSKISESDCKNMLSECGAFNIGKDYFVDGFIAEECDYDLKKLSKRLGCNL